MGEGPVRGPERVDAGNPDGGSQAVGLQPGRVHAQAVRGLKYPPFSVGCSGPKEQPLPVPELHMCQQVSKVQCGFCRGERVEVDQPEAPFPGADENLFVVKVTVAQDRSLRGGGQQHQVHPFDGVSKRRARGL